MKIIGPETLTFGVDEVEACARYLTDYGLRPVGVDASGGRFEALDGTAVILRHREDPGLPAALGTASMLRKTLYGVTDAPPLPRLPRNSARTARCARSPTDRSKRSMTWGSPSAFR